jgi:thioesterase domain-containing protein
MIHHSISRTVDELAPIWQRVLDKKVIDPDQNFFDLGGNPEIIEKLFLEIARELRRELNPLLIYQAPTIVKFAALLASAQPPTVASVLHLNTLVDEPPIFISHGIGGTVIGLFQLVQQMHCPFAIYGMQPRGVDDRKKPFDRIEDMAQYHLEAIREIQPHGPYYLVGYSLGGLITLEIAQRLTKSGEKIGLLLMLDSYPDIWQLRLPQLVPLLWQRARKHLLPVVGEYQQSRTTSQSVNNAFDFRMFPFMSAALEGVRTAQYEALRAYKPSFYDGEIGFVQAAVVSHFPRNAEAVWKPLVRKLEYQSVACDHVSMLTTHASALSSIIMQYLKGIHHD